MQHSRTITKLLRSEEGRSLPFALVVVAVGALLVSPFLAHVSTSLLGSRAMQGGMNKQYASDAGVEFGIWKLVNDSTFRSQVDAIPGTPVATGPITVNQFTTNITVTALSAGGWTTLADAPNNVRTGGALAYASGDYIYALRGNNTNDFWRYSISGNSWVTRADTPRNVEAGGALTYDGTYIYALRGNNSRSFWRFSPGPSTYDITATADGVTISAQIVISGTDVTIQAWDIE